MSVRGARVFGLLLHLFLAVLTQIACTTVPGAPKDDDEYGIESAGEAIEDEEEEEASREDDL